MNINGIPKRMFENIFPSGAAAPKLWEEAQVILELIKELESLNRK